jgi:hypothetical protein
MIEQETVQRDDFTDAEKFSMSLPSGFPSLLVKADGNFFVSAPLSVHASAR